MKTSKKIERIPLVFAFIEETKTEKHGKVQSEIPTTNTLATDPDLRKKESIYKDKEFYRFSVNEDPFLTGIVCRRENRSMKAGNEILDIAMDLAYKNYLNEKKKSSIRKVRVSRGCCTW